MKYSFSVFATALSFITMNAMGQPVSPETKVLSMYCHDQYWMKLPPESGKKGVWMTGIGMERKVTLSKDPNYPNPNEPKTVWIGQHKEKLNGADVTVTLQIAELSGKLEIGKRWNTISISLNGITADSDGGSYLRTSFHDDSSGVGVICHEMTVQ
ncbi:MAG: hypothetical protein AB7G93_15945 [Bdellovibrionales bacterium]